MASCLHPVFPAIWEELPFMSDIPQGREPGDGQGFLLLNATLALALKFASIWPKGKAHLAGGMG